MSYVGSSSTAAADDDYHRHGTAHVVVIGVLLAVTSLTSFHSASLWTGGSGREKAREKHGASSSHVKLFFISSFLPGVLIDLCSFGIHI